MDYIIFRRETNGFVRYSDGELYVTSDKDEIKDEYNKEVADGTNPIIITLVYGHYFDSEGQEHQKVTLEDEKGNPISMFTYKAHFDDDNDFLDAFDDWEKDFKKSVNRLFI